MYTFPESKTISLDQRLIQSNPISRLQNQKGKKHTRNTDKSSRKTRMISRISSSFPNRWSFSYYISISDLEQRLKFALNAEHITDLPKTLQVLFYVVFHNLEPQNAGHVDVR